MNKSIFILINIFCIIVLFAGCVQTTSTSAQTDSQTTFKQPNNSAVTISVDKKDITQADQNQGSHPDYYLKEGMQLTISEIGVNPNAPTKINAQTKIDEINKLISSNPSDPSLWNQKGYIIYVNGLVSEEAILCFDKAIELNPNFVPALNNRGYMARNDYSKAMELYNKALSINPNDSSVLNNKGMTLIDYIHHQSLEGQTVNSTKRHTSPFKSEALNYFDLALANNPNDPIIWNNKGMAIWFFSNKTNTNYEVILACFDKSLAIEPSFKSASINKNRLNDWYLNLKANN